MAKKFATDKPTFAEIRKLKKRNRRSVEILLDPDLKVRILDLRARIKTETRRDLRQNRAPVAPGLQKELDLLEESASESEVSFVFEALGNKAYSDLIDEHPPTDEQITEFGRLEWNPETFPPAVIQASCIEPELTPDDVEHIMEEFSSGDVQALFNTALLVNVERASVPFTATDTARTPDSPLNSISALEEELQSLTDGS